MRHGHRAEGTGRHHLPEMPKADVIGTFEGELGSVIFYCIHRRIAHELCDARKSDWKKCVLAELIRAETTMRLGQRGSGDGNQELELVLLSDLQNTHQARVGPEAA